MKDQSNIPLILNGYPFPSMDYTDTGIKGVGRDRRPIVCMDEFIDHSMDDELHIECCKGLAKCSLVTPGGMFYGGVPPETQVEFGERDAWDVMLRELPKYDPTGIHKTAIDEILSGPEEDEYKKSCVWRYAYYALGAIIPWFFVVYLKLNHFTTKTSDVGSSWSPNAKHFPKLIQYLKTLPFEHIGRVLFFTTYPNAPIATHRDSVVKEHQDHNINLFFTGGDRQSYIYDPSTKEKIYLDKGSRSYFFNNRDFHGVDADSRFRYTLRVDGTFNKDLQDVLKLEDGYTWKWDYEQQV
jgi:hypothetical protein